MESKNELIDVSYYKLEYSSYYIVFLHRHLLTFFLCLPVPPFLDVAAFLETCSGSDDDTDDISFPPVISPTTASTEGTATTAITVKMVAIEYFMMMMMMMMREV